MKHRCKDCGNTEKFYASAVEYHTWLVDGNADFIEDKELSESDHVHITACAKCGKDNIERID